MRKKNYSKKIYFQEGHIVRKNEERDASFVILDRYFLDKIDKFVTKESKFEEINEKLF